MPQTKEDLIKQGIMIRVAAQKALLVLAQRAHTKMSEEKLRWLSEIDRLAGTEGCTFLQLAEEVNRELRRRHSLPEELPPAAKVKQSRSNELWEDFAMIHWGYLNWYGDDKFDPEPRRAWFHIKKMEDSVREHNASKVNDDEKS